MQQLCAAAEVALAPILSNQTGNTIMHLMCHLREQAGREGTEPVSTAYRLLRLSCSSHACTEDNIAQAFLTLGAAASGHVSGEQLLALLALLTEALPEQLSDTLMTQLFSTLARLPPDLATFRAATKACLLLEELQDAQLSPSDASFRAAEARELLAQLLQQCAWFAALEPLPAADSLSSLRDLTMPPRAAAAAAAEHAARQAAQLVQLAARSA